MSGSRSFALLLATLLPVAGCTAEHAPVAHEFDGPTAMARVETQLAFGPRVPGTAPHRAMAAWLDSLARAGADTVVTQTWTHVTATGDSVPMTNIIARFNPAATERVLYLAHWDTRPRADAPGSEHPDQPIPGANDGASGVAVLLGVMDALRANRPTIGVDLAFLDGEDYGEFTPPLADVLIGARYYADHLLPPGKPDFAVLWDMVGAKDLKIAQEPQSAVAAPDVMTMVWAVAERLGYGHVFVNEPGATMTDDHIPLIDAGIRAIDIIGWPYQYWHTVDDTADKLSVESLEAVGNTAVAVIREADGEK
jgi:hypothetical protein